MLVSPNDNDSPDEFEKKIMAGVRDHFVRKLQRPELLNRIGENVVIFNFISPEAASSMACWETSGSGYAKNIKSP